MLKELITANLLTAETLLKIESNLLVQKHDEERGLLVMSRQDFDLMNSTLALIDQAFEQDAGIVASERATTKGAYQSKDFADLAFESCPHDNDADCMQNHE